MDLCVGNPSFFKSYHIISIIFGIPKSNQGKVTHIKMKSLTLTILVLLSFGLATISQTMVSTGEVAGLWTKNNSPYIITGSITVPEDGKLAIEPGVEVLFEGPYVMEVFGRLEATGTYDENINFSMLDTTGFSSDDYLGWLGLSFMNVSSNPQEASLLGYINFEYSAGSAITCYFAQLEASNIKISNNKGYGIYLASTIDASFENIQIISNALGGVKSDGSLPQISNFEIMGNSGPGILLLGGTNSGEQAVLKQGLIADNTSTNGGGVVVGMEASLYLEEIIIQNNTAVNGGGIYCNMGYLDMVNVNISHNQAEYGGGLNIKGWSSVSIHNTLISNNSVSFYGGAIFNEASSLQINKTTIADNTASESGSAIDYMYIENKINTISNSILWDNYPEEIYTFDGIPEVKYSDIMGGYEGLEVINEDPLFVDADNSNYHLSWNTYPQVSGFKSPAIDGGDPTIDFDPDGTIADMGAFYFDQTVFTATKEIVDLFFKVYPNPASDFIKISSEQNIEKVQMINLSGQVVWEGSNIFLNSKINISDMDKGLYIINLVTEDGKVLTEKMIKE
jgi:hypothetical protein